MRVERRSTDPDSSATSPRRLDQPPALPETDLDDRELTLAFQRGEKGAYQAIYEKHSARVFRICGRILNQPDDAQEAAQETFARVYLALGKFNGRYQLGAWIARIATNVCLDQLRARTRRPVDVAPLEAIDARLAEKTPKNDPEELVMRGQEGNDVRLLLESLPPLHRAAIVLRDIEGFSYLEIAAALDMSESQVKALLHRARAGFKRSWMARALSALVPARFLHRSRIAEHMNSGNEHVLQTVGSSLNVAASCGSTLAQCGQYVSERAAAGIAALVVGSAAVAGAGVAATAPVPEPSAPVVVAASDSQPLDNKHSEKEVAAKRDEASSVDTPPDTPPEAQPSAEPSTTPTPDPTATATPPATEAGEGSGESQEPEEELPSGFFPAVGFDWGNPVPARVPKAHEATVSCKGPQLIQRLETSIDDRKGRAHPAVLMVDTGSTSSMLGKISIELTVDPGPKAIYYSGSGVLTDEASSGDSMSLSFEGEYGTFNQKALATDLPQSGDFSVSLGLDCAAQSVVTESVILATE